MPVCFYIVCVFIYLKCNELFMDALKVIVAAVLALLGIWSERFTVDQSQLSQEQQTAKKNFKE